MNERYSKSAKLTDLNRLQSLKRNCMTFYEISSKKFHFKTNGLKSVSTKRRKLPQNLNEMLSDLNGNRHAVPVSRCV